MFRCLRRWGGVSVETFWMRLIVILLSQCALAFMFIQYQASGYQRIRIGDRSLEPGSPAHVTMDQIRSINITLDRNFINVTPDRNSVNDTSDRYSVNDTSDRNSVNDTSERNSVNDTSERNPVNDTSERKSVNDTSERNSVNDTSERNSVKDTSDRNSVNDTSDRNSSDPDLPGCPLVPPGLNGHISVNTTEYSEKELAERLPLLKAGGTFRPSSCTPRHSVAIIIPFRNRHTHLKILLNNLHPFLQKQQLDYGIFVSELDNNVSFNKAVSMNIGFLEAKKYGYNCFIFHDVDLIPENDNNMYICPDNPKHMSVAIDKFDYELPYVKLFGGVTAMTKEQFEAVNGYSNKYFGWGAEDDDMYARIRTVGLAVTRYTSDVSTYRMLHHTQETKNEYKDQLLKSGTDRWKHDGLNTIKYRVLKTVRKPLYTYILADIDMKDKAYHQSREKVDHQTGVEVHQQPYINKPIHLLDEKVEELLIEKAKYLLNTDQLHPRIKNMLIFEFYLLGTSMVTTENVSGTLKKILPLFSWSAEHLQKLNMFHQEQWSADKNGKPPRFWIKGKDDVFSNVKMSLLINNFHENMKRIMQKPFEEQKSFKHQ